MVVAVVVVVTVSRSGVQPSSSLPSCSNTPLSRWLPSLSDETPRDCWLTCNWWLLAVDDVDIGPLNLRGDDDFRGARSCSNSDSMSLGNVPELSRGEGELVRGKLLRGSGLERGGMSEPARRSPATSRLEGKEELRATGSVLDTAEERRWGGVG